MKHVVVITANSRRHRFFVKQAQTVFGDALAGIIVQELSAPQSKAYDSEKLSLCQKVFRGLFRPAYSLRWLGRYVRLKRSGARMRRIQDQFYPMQDDAFPDDVPVHYTSDVNSSDTETFISLKEPNLILVFGGKILKPKIIRLAPTILNFHYGIVPWYRSSASTTWAIAREDIKNIGGTIHLVNEGIDTGHIIEYCYPELMAVDTLGVIVEKVRRQGIEHLIENGKMVLEGKKLHAYLQGENGRTYYSRMLNEEITGRAWNNLANGIIGQFLYRSRYAHSNVRTRASDHEIPTGVYIVLYHTIIEAAPKSLMEERTGTGEAIFDRHLDFYAQNFQVIPLDDAVRILREKEGNIQERYLVITFDDAYRSVLDKAVPKLCERQYPASLFINHDPASGNKGIWRVRLSILLEGKKEECVKAFCYRFGVSMQSALDVYNYAKNNYSRDMETLIDDLWSTADFGQKDLDLFMSYEDFRTLDDRLFTFGSHTVKHPVLLALSRLEVEREILDGHRGVEEALERPIRYFSYPFGNFNHWCADTELVIQQLKGVMAFTANGGVNRYLHPLHIRRIGLRNESEDELKCLFVREGKALS